MYDLGKARKAGKTEMLGWLLWVILLSVFNPASAAEIAEPLSHFWLDGRLSIKVESFNQPAQQVSGRIVWLHRGDNDQVRVFSPFGQILAELNGKPGWVEAHLANGRQFQAESINQLFQQGLGYPIPVESLPDWLMGRTSPSAGSNGLSSLEWDERQRPTLLIEGLWRIRYAYSADATLPSSIQVTSEEGITLRLLIDRWLTGSDALSGKEIDDLTP